MNLPRVYPEHITRIIQTHEIYTVRDRNPVVTCYAHHEHSNGHSISKCVVKSCRECCCKRSKNAEFCQEHRYPPSFEDSRTSTSKSSVMQFLLTREIVGRNNNKGNQSTKQIKLEPVFIQSEEDICAIEGCNTLLTEGYFDERMQSPYEYYGDDCENAECIMCGTRICQEHGTYNAKDTSDYDYYCRQCFEQNFPDSSSEEESSEEESSGEEQEETDES